MDATALEVWRRRRRRRRRKEGVCVKEGNGVEVECASV